MVIPKKDLAYGLCSNSPKDDSVFEKISKNLSEVTIRQITQWLMPDIAVEKIFQGQSPPAQKARQEITRVHIPRLIYHILWNLTGGGCKEGDFSPHGKNYLIDLSQISIKYPTDTQIPQQPPDTEIIFMWLRGPANSNRPFFQIQSSILEPSQLSKIMDIVREQRYECRPHYGLHIIRSSKGGFAPYSYLAMILLSPIKNGKKSGNYSLTIIPLHSEECPHSSKVV